MAAAAPPRRCVRCLATPPEHELVAYRANEALLPLLHVHRSCLQTLQLQLRGVPICRGTALPAAQFRPRPKG